MNQQSTSAANRNQKGSSLSFSAAVVIQSLSRVRLFATLWTVAHHAFLPFAISWSLLKLMSIELVMPSNHLILCYPPLLLPLIFPSSRVFSNESALCNRWPKYWTFSFSIGSSSEYSGLISFRIDWFDLLAVQGTLKSLVQHHSSKGISSLALSLLYCPTLPSIRDYWKIIALSIRTFVGKVMSLLFNALSRFVIVSFPRIKCLLISWLLSPSTVVLEPKKI